MAQSPNDELLNAGFSVVIGPYRETDMGSQDLASAGLSVAMINFIEKTFRTLGDILEDIFRGLGSVIALLLGLFAKYYLILVIIFIILALLNF